MGGSIHQYHLLKPKNCICCHSLNFFRLFVTVEQDAQIWFACDAVLAFLNFSFEHWYLQR